MNLVIIFSFGNAPNYLVGCVIQKRYNVALACLASISDFDDEIVGEKYYL